MKKSQLILPLLKPNPNPRSWISLTIMNYHLLPSTLHHLQILQPAATNSRANNILKSLRHFIKHVVGVGQWSRRRQISMGLSTRRRSMTWNETSGRRSEPWTIVWSFGIACSLKPVGRRPTLHFSFTGACSIWDTGVNGELDKDRRV